VTLSRSVVPGSWYGVLGSDVVVLLPPAARSRVAGVWECVDEGAGFDEVLDALISGGLRELPGFVLVSCEGSDGRVVIRGAGRAELVTEDGPVTVSGAHDTTWVEHSAAGVSALRIRVDDGDGAAYPFGNGLVRVAEIQQPAVATAPTALAPSSADVGDPEPAPPVPAQPRPVAQGPVARLVFSSGEIVDVDRSVLVGRSPDSRGLGGDDTSRLVTVPSPHQEISSTHLEIRPGAGADHGAAVVTDLGSTNGTVIVQPGLPAEDLRPGVAVQVVPGAVVDLGEGVTIQVTAV
jgi:hypothetical protein